MNRGDIYIMRLPRVASRGRVLDDPRYGIVVQSDALRGLSTVLVAPTSDTARALTFRPEVEVDGHPRRVLVEHTRVIDVERLQLQVGYLTAMEQRAVDEALRTILGLKSNRQ